MKIFQKYFVYIFCFISYFTNLNATTKQEIISQIDKQTKIDTSVVDLYLKFAKIVDHDLKSYSVEHERLYRGLSIAKELRYHDIEMINLIGKIHRNRGEFDSARYYHNEALNLSRKRQLVYQEIISLNNLGTVYRRIDNMEYALKLHAKALLLSEINKFTELIAISANCIGNVSISLENYDDAKKYFFKAVEMQKKDNNLTGVAINYNNIGAVCQAKGKLSEARNYYLKSLSINKHLGDLIGCAINYSDLGSVAEKKKRYTEALELYQKSIDINKKIGNNYYLTGEFIKYGKVTIKLKNYSEAEKYLNKGLALANEYNTNSRKKAALEGLLEHAETQGDYKKAFDYLKRVIKIDKIMLNSQNKDLATKIAIRYRTDLKESKIKSLQKYKRQQNLINILLIVIVVLAIIYLVLIIKRLRHSRHFSQVLEEKNKIIGDNVISLQQRNEELLHLNSVKDKFFTIIGHDLKNPLHAIQLSSEMLLKYYDKFDEPLLMKTFQGIFDEANKSNELFDSLLDWANVQIGAITPAPVDVNLDLVFDETTTDIGILFRNKNLSVYKEVDPDLTAFTDENMLNTIIKNLLSNAAKFTPENGKITISAHQNGEDDILIIIEDNGVGMSPKKVSTLFNFSDFRSSNGTQGETGSGLGLPLCYVFVTCQGGKIKCESTENKGTKIYFTVKRYKKDTKE